jgi:hypothetical protein
MSNEMSLFGGNSLVSGSLFDELQKLSQNLMSGGGGGGVPRISIRGGRFRQIEGGEQVAVSSDSTMNIVIVNAAPISRMYYSGAYDSEKIVPPSCWSRDGKVPGEDVPEDSRQSDSCFNCAQNIKGSGSGESRACRFNQRIAVCLEGDYSKVFQLQLPATSIFGEANGNNMPMAAYAKFLHAHKTPAAAIVTSMFFDDNSDTPKLFFKPLRPLEEAELKQVLQISTSDKAMRAIEMTVAQADGVIATDSPKQETKPKLEKKKKPEPEPEPEPEPKADPVLVDLSEDDDDMPEPVKAKSKKAAAPEPSEDDDLSSLVSEWDD